MNDVDILKALKDADVRVPEALFTLSMAICKLAVATDLPKDGMMLAIGSTYDEVEKIVKKMREKKSCH